MKKLKNKKWLERHAIRKHEKELKRRCRLDAKLCFISPDSRHNDLVDYRVLKNKFETLVAPENFSIHSNPEGMLEFFSRIKAKVKQAKPIQFEMKRILNLSIDAVMYFFAIMQRLKYTKIHYGFKGNWPKDKKCRKLLIDAGFLDYVDFKKITVLNHETDVIRIVNGNNADDSVAKKICDFTMARLKIQRVEIKKLYTIIIELMTNTKHHAYETERYNLFPNWYIFCKYNESNDTIRYIFLDTGEGIPSTIRRYAYDKVRSLMGESHSKFIRSALEGIIRRTRTGESHRGKGLPKVYSFYLEKYIKELTIISNHGYVFGQSQNTDLKRKLEGTLFYWELSRSA